MELSPAFTKMSGTGNSFLITDSRTAESRASLTSHFQKPRPEIARQLCSPERGGGADGLIFIDEARSEEAAFRWDFYNADGSSAEMCGNATRCVARYFQVRIDPRKTALRFESEAGLIDAHILDEQQIRVLMPITKEEQQQMNLQAGSFARTFTWINTGVPHIVTEVENVNLDELIHEARLFRKHEALGSRGANVTYYKKLASQKIEAYSFERGVEDFTLSCGTGAVAAASVFRKDLDPESEVQVKVRGGELLVGKDPRQQRPTLTGEARFLSEIRFY